MPQCIVNLLLHVKYYVLMHFFFFKGVGSDLHLCLKVQQESQYEDRGGLKCSRCSETAVIHGDILITDPQTLSSVSSVFTGLVNHSLF